MITFKTFLLLEAREDFVARQLGPKLAARYAQDTGKSPSTPPIDVVNQLAQAGSKYIQWIAKQYVAGQFKMEDVSRLKRELVEFDRVKNRLQVKDINQYKDLRQLYAALKPFENVENVSNKQTKQSIKTQGADKIFENGDALVYRIKTQEAACLIGRGTKWCTAATEGDNYFEYYNRKGPLFVVIMKDSNEKYQFHFAEKQFMDSEDQQIDLPEFAYQYPDVMSAIVLHDPECAFYEDSVGPILPYLSDKAQTTMLEHNYWLLASIPKDSRTKQQCMAALKNDWRAYRLFPEKFQSLPMSYKVVMQLEKSVGHVWGEYIPKEHFAPIKEHMQRLRELKYFENMYKDDVDVLKILTNPKTRQESKTEEAQRYLDELIVSYKGKLKDYQSNIAQIKQQIEAFEKGK